MRHLACLLLLFGCAAGAQPVPGPTTLPGPDGVELRTVLVAARPGVPAAAPVVALHGCGGLGGPGAPPRLPRREADWATRLAALGHTVLFPDSFGSRGVTETCRGGDWGVEPATIRRDDALAAAAWAAAQPWAAPGGAVLLGWSHGGSTVLAAVAAAPPGLLRGAVAFYPGCGRILRASPEFAPRAPLLLLLGAADEWTPPASCRALAARAPSQVEVVEHPDAHHGFDQPDMPLRELTGLAQTSRGGRAHMGTDAVGREDALRRVPAFIAGLEAGQGLR